MQTAFHALPEVTWAPRVESSNRTPVATGARDAWPELSDRIAIRVNEGSTVGEVIR